MNVGWLVLIVLLVVGYPIVRTESFHYQESLHECWKKHTANKNLLGSELCRNPHQRLQYGNAGTVDCDRAERELLLSPNQCAFKLWWKQTEIVNMYNRIAGSYWTLMGIFLPLVMLAMYLYSKHVRERQSEERFYDRQTKFVSQFLPLKQQQQERPRIEEIDGEYDAPTFNVLESKYSKR